MNNPALHLAPPFETTNATSEIDPEAIDDKRVRLTYRSQLILPVRSAVGRRARRTSVFERLFAWLRPRKDRELPIATDPSSPSGTEAPWSGPRRLTAKVVSCEEDLENDGIRLFLDVPFLRVLDRIPGIDGGPATWVGLAQPYRVGQGQVGLRRVMGVLEVLDG